METNVRTPLDVFHLPQHLVVPIFQRPYVWDETDQWVPLWQDVRRIAELRLADGYSQATHFLGAVVLQAQENSTGVMQSRNVIDGQQRITTLSLLMDAAGAVLESNDYEKLAGQLEDLTHNSDRHVRQDEDLLKLRHTNRDRAAYDEVMRADPPIDYTTLTNESSLIVRAHAYFTAAVTEWLQDPSAEEYEPRADALVDVLTRGLQLVAIDLRSTENSQEIFETLNARGTPLTAADLIKNFVFQTLEAEGADTQRAYSEDWPFEAKFWEEEVSVGRYLVSRGSLFLNQWLIARTGDEVGPKQTFTRFKHFVEHESGHKMADLLPTIKAQAELYEQWHRLAQDTNRDLDPVEMCVYRSVAGGLELIKPALIWLHEPETPLSPATIHGVVSAIESWIFRRMLLRLTSSDLGRVVASVIATHQDRDETLPARVQGYLSRLNVASTYWPGDIEVRTALREESAYRRFSRPRLRMMLEAAEDHLRGYTGAGNAAAGGRIARVGYHIEHLLPQKWSTHWPVDDLSAELERAAHVHRLGNLTLLTAKLNQSVSNAAWLGENGKREKLHAHDVFLLNRRILDVSQEGWTETLIDHRTDALVNALLATWPVPPDHEGVVVDAVAAEPTWIGVEHLLAAGMLQPGQTLEAKASAHRGAQCVVQPDGTLLMDGTIFTSPSAAGHHLQHKATNGWYFWGTTDGRRLRDIRDEYRAQVKAAPGDPN